MNLLNSLRKESAKAPVSGIEAVTNYGRGRPGLIPLWYGEGDQVTPDFISQAAVEALDDGETFYTWQGGIPDLRTALARYHQRHFGRMFDSQEFVVTIGGMHAIRLALEATAGQSDELIYFTPAWPNINVAASIGGISPIPVALTNEGGRWVCDLDKLEAAITPRTRVLFVNTPSNPTGWVADQSTLHSILDIARRHGLWIIADEIYSLFHYGEGRASSFYDVMEPDDRILFVNTFSKNWSMTGWRVGWLATHPSLSRTFENLIQYSSSGVAQFIQRGAVAALEQGDDFVAAQVRHSLGARELVCRILSQTNRVNITVPEGAFYLFFSIDGVLDSEATAIEMVNEAEVGLAPGRAFGAAGEGYFRLCFLRDHRKLEEAAQRLVRWIGSQ